MSYSGRISIPLLLALFLSVGTLTLTTGCQPDETGSYAAYNHNDCLPDVTLTDQNGNKVSLPSLKGKPVLVDFIYTSCTGPCPLLTEKFASIARRLGPQVGNSIELISFTLDPEHDGVRQLKSYADTHGAEHPGWLFLTGTPEQVEQVLAAYGIKRAREADGSVTHMVTTFLLGPDGRQVRQYSGERVTARTVVADIDRVLSKRG